MPHRSFAWITAALLAMAVKQDWPPIATSSAQPLRPVGSGIDWVLGAGGYRGRIGIGIRYQFAGTARIHADGLPITAHTVALTVQWIVRRKPGG